MMNTAAIYAASSSLSAVIGLELGYDPIMVLMSAIAAGYTVVNLPSVHWFKGIMTVAVIVLLAINFAPFVTHEVLELESVNLKRGIAVVISVLAQAAIIWGQKQIGLLNVADVAIAALRKKLGLATDKPEGN